MNIGILSCIFYNTVSKNYFSLAYKPLVKSWTQLSQLSLSDSSLVVKSWTSLESARPYSIMVLYDLILWDVNFFVRVLGQSFVITKFATDVFTNDTSSIVFAVIKFVSVTRFQICTIVASIYIRY